MPKRCENLADERSVCTENLSITCYILWADLEISNFFPDNINTNNMMYVPVILVEIMRGKNESWLVFGAVYDVHELFLLNLNWIYLKRNQTIAKKKTRNLTNWTFSRQFRCYENVNKYFYLSEAISKVRNDFLVRKWRIIIFAAF